MKLRLPVKHAFLAAVYSYALLYDQAFAPPHASAVQNGDHGVWPGLVQAKSIQALFASRRTPKRKYMYNESQLNSCILRG